MICTIYSVNMGLSTTVWGDNVILLCSESVLIPSCLKYCEHLSMIMSVIQHTHNLVFS